MSDNTNIKYKTLIRKQCINALAWLENNPNPQTDEELAKLLEILGKFKQYVQVYCENIRQYGWEKHSTTIPLDNSKILEHQKFLDETQGHTDIVGGN